MSEEASQPTGFPVRQRSRSVGTHPSSGQQQQLSDDFISLCLPAAQTDRQDTLSGRVRTTIQGVAYLREIYHVRSCTAGVACSNPKCRHVKALMAHSARCTNPACSFAGCRPTKILVAHVNVCGTGLYDYCELCTMATSSKRGDGDSDKLSNSASSDVKDKEEESYLNEEEEEDEDLHPIINYEIIEFSRVPFQPFPSVDSRRSSISSSSNGESPLTSSPRTKTHADFQLIFDQPAKRRKSKSFSEGMGTGDVD
eukprot:scaffold1406_cov182-Ochromonas_danica.AAC.2